MNKYEGIVIFRPDLTEEELEKEYSKAEETVRKHEGAVEKTEKWGKKKLGFTIKKCREGFFLYLAFEAPPASVRVFTDNFKIDPQILRAQIVRKEVKNG